MGALEFIASLVGSVLSWPVIVGVIVLVLLGPLKELIGRVQTFEAGGFKSSFGKGLSAAEDTTKEAVQLAEEEPSPAPQVPVAQGPGDAMTVLEAWKQLEIALRELYSAAGLASGGRGRPPGPTTMATALNETGHVNDAFERAVRELQDLRNQVAHTRYEPSSGEVAAYIETATELSKAARYFAEHIASTKG